MEDQKGDSDSIFDIMPTNVNGEVKKAKMEIGPNHIDDKGGSDTEMELNSIDIETKSRPYHMDLKQETRSHDALFNPGQDHTGEMVAGPADDEEKSKQGCKHTPKGDKSGSAIIKEVSIQLVPVDEEIKRMNSNLNCLVEGKTVDHYVSKDYISIRDQDLQEDIVDKTDKNHDTVIDVESFKPGIKNQCDDLKADTNADKIKVGVLFQVWTV